MTLPRILLLSALLALAGLVACKSMSEEQRAAIEQTITEMKAEGTLTEKDVAVVRALERQLEGEGLDWEMLLVILGNLAAAFFGAPYIVRKMRGPPSKPQLDALTAMTAELARELNVPFHMGYPGNFPQPPQPPLPPLPPQPPNSTA